MKFQVPFSICPLLTILLLMLMPHTAPAQYDYDYFSDRVSREHRDAGDVEDWIERGNATVTGSPRFENGIRLTAWASESESAENYEFAIASAIYLFEIPRQAQYVEILVRYRGEPHRADFDYDEIAGRVWIRNTKREYSRRHYNQNAEDETLYGDTFFLRAKRRSETIKVATAGRVESGILEMHIVAENGEHLDIEYVNVVTYQRQPDVRVIHRYARDYHWKPWYRYTYLYFYDGPFYYCTDLGYYIRWSYPVYDHHYVAIRRAYGTYLHDYYRHYPRRHHRNSYYHSGVHIRKSPDRQRLNRWTATHETTRREYSRSRLSVTTSKTNKTNVQTRVRSLITEHRQTPVLADRVSQRSTLSRKRKLPNTRSEPNTTIQRQDRKPNTTIQRQDRNRQPSSDVSSRSYRATQQILKRKRLGSVERKPQSNVQSRNAPPQTYQYDRYRFAPRNQRSSDNEVSTRSNAERRVRLYNRTQSSRSRLSTPPSRSRSSTVKQRTETRSRVKQSKSRSSTTTAPRIQRPTTQQTTSSSSSKDDDDEKQERSRNTTRTKTRSRRK